ncbi:hypothetical protein HG536_0F04360 [Torulaspora globosa]|uniref:GDS1 winged helix domain-containing protein n=1 Tax=Torulaspora globosa TaxID=48254 RepID=A0A7G3ZKS4_9SACH|nr:uncharacterized protein HG536_0F04360 [Torulaspora globosa]QLL34110.1 hypothetical protein HG536_0F04360 [Torulaspora globosa]
MALTNPRPLQIPALQNEILHNTASPVFQASSLVFNPKNDVSGFPNTPTSEGSPSDTGKARKEGSVTPKKDSLTLEISKIIPVTGERPMPEERTAPLDDDVLYAVFVILWEKDPELQGMTVKQLSDHLLEKHPEMSNLSTKLSNLISAKLNAYVKKLEKGEKTLTYALSREWSNSSPRRMVYVYRGILSPDYKKHAHAAAVHMKQQQGSKDGKNASDNDLKRNSTGFSDVGPDGNKQGSGAANLGFSLSPEFKIPYATSPVSAILTPSSTGDGSAGDHLTDKKRSRMDGDDTGSFTVNSKKTKIDSNDQHTESSKTDPNPVGTYVTAAAAAPRLSKFSSKNFKGNSQNSASLVAAIHKVFLTQTPIDPRPVAAASHPKEQSYDHHFGSWIKTVREGFLSHDIESPENLSMEELECILDS